MGGGKVLLHLRQSLHWPDEEREGRPNTSITAYAFVDHSPLHQQANVHMTKAGRGERGQRELKSKDKQRWIPKSKINYSHQQGSVADYTTLCYRQQYFVNWLLRWLPLLLHLTSQPHFPILVLQLYAYILANIGLYFLHLKEYAIINLFEYNLAGCNLSRPIKINRPKWAVPSNFHGPTLDRNNAGSNPYLLTVLFCHGRLPPSRHNSWMNTYLITGEICWMKVLGDLKQRYKMTFINCSRTIAPRMGF